MPYYRVLRKEIHARVMSLTLKIASKHRVMSPAFQAVLGRVRVPLDAPKQEKVTPCLILVNIRQEKAG